MKISNDERLAIRAVIMLGKEFGYGNLMGHLATAWARDMMTDYHMTESQARRCPPCQGYPFEMQDDLLERGEWDETGERYQKRET